MTAEPIDLTSEEVAWHALPIEEVSEKVDAPEAG